MFRHIFWASCVLFLSPSLQARTLALPQDITAPLSCEKSFQSHLQKYFKKQSPQWHQVVGPSYDVRAFRSPTEKNGEWIELHVPEKGAPSFSVISSKQNLYHHWDDKNCKAHVSREKGFAFHTFEKNPQGELFDDRALQQLLAEKKKGLIYLWSPRMVYSVTEFRRFRDVAKNKGWDFIAVLDPQIPDREARAAVEKFNIEYQGRRLASVDIYMREGLLHYPSVFVYSNGKLHPDRLIGVLTSEDIARLADQKMGELQ